LNECSFNGIMPRNAQQNQTLRSATRQKLVASALFLFARDGYTATSVRSIAEQAGVATGLLYSHFDGKEGLLRVVFEESMLDVRASFAIADSAEPADRIAALIRGSVQIVREHLDFWRLGYAARTQPAVLAALGPALTEWTDSIVGTLRSYLSSAGSLEPAMEAWALFGQIDGMCQHYALQPDRYPIEAVAEQVIARWALPPTTLDQRS